MSIYPNIHVLRRSIMPVKLLFLYRRRPFGVEPWPFWKSVSTLFFFSWVTLLSFVLPASPLLLKRRPPKAQVTLLRAYSTVLCQSLFRGWQDDRHWAARVIASVFMLEPTRPIFSINLFLIPTLFSFSIILFFFGLWPFPPSLPTNLTSWNCFLKKRRPCSPVAAPLLHFYHPHQMLVPLFDSWTHHLGCSRAPPHRG